MHTIGIIGAESVGKTTLCRYLAHEFGGWTEDEYARGYVEALNRPYNREDVLRIARYQIDREMELRAKLSISGFDYVFFDTELIMTKVWLLDKYGDCPGWIERHIERHPLDLYLLLRPNIPFVADPVRENGHRREELTEWYERELRRYSVVYRII